jgi:hypothetical protein
MHVFSAPARISLCRAPFPGPARYRSDPKSRHRPSDHGILLAKGYVWSLRYTGCGPAGRVRPAARPHTELNFLPCPSPVLPNEVIFRVLGPQRIAPIPWDRLAAPQHLPASQSVLLHLQSSGCMNGEHLPAFIRAGKRITGAAGSHYRAGSGLRAWLSLHGAAKSIRQNKAQLLRTPPQPASSESISMCKRIG